MKYTIIIDKAAEKFINRLAKSEKIRVLHAIQKLPFEGDIRPLQGGNNAGLFRLRVGHYRVIYSVDHGRLIVHVIDAGNRGQVYNRY